LLAQKSKLVILNKGSNMQNSCKNNQNQNQKPKNNQNREENNQENYKKPGSCGK